MIKLYWQTATFIFSLVSQSAFIATQIFSNCVAKLGIAYTALWKHVPCGTVRKTQSYYTEDPVWKWR